MPSCGGVEPWKGVASVQGGKAFHPRQSHGYLSAYAPCPRIAFGRNQDLPVGSCWRRERGRYASFAQASVSEKYETLRRGLAQRQRESGIPRMNPELA